MTKKNYKVILKITAQVLKDISNLVKDIHSLIRECRKLAACVWSSCKIIKGILDIIRDLF